MSKYIVRAANTFQFQYGAIKSHIAGNKGINVPCFNSNMVRLKEIIISQSISEILQFQFQYGAIKSAKSGDLTDIAPLFQFQYGAIKRSRGN